MALTQTICDSLQLTDNEEESGNIFYVRNAENVDNLKDTAKSCNKNKQETKNGKNICNKAENDVLQMVLNYRQCEVGYAIVAKEITDGNKAYICNRTVCNDISVDFDADPENCGGCGKNCDKNEICISGKCEELKCDGNETPCYDLCLNLNSLHAASCNGKELKCQIDYGDCDNDNSNGCESLLLYDPNNCGECGVKCEENKVCVAGACVVNECNASNGETVCIVNDQKICTVVKGDDIANCGFCGYDCNSIIPPNAKVSGCNVGQYEFSCLEGYQNISAKTPNNSAQNIQCVDISNDDEHCGTDISILTDCKLTPGTTCQNGACQLNCAEDQVICGNQCINLNIVHAASCDNNTLTCKENYGDCDKNITNGCESSLLSDSNNCGGCGKSCKANEVCAGGDCVVNNCDISKGETVCIADGQKKCTVVKGNDIKNCGFCGYDCSSITPSNAEASGCAAGQCQYECATDGYANISTEEPVNSAQNIQCVNILNDDKHCGKTADSLKDCTKTSGKTCKDGECVLNCSVNQPDICGTVCLNFDVLHIKSCVNGTITCDDNYRNFDKAINNGCEVNIKTDSNHCGVNNIQCNGGQSCKEGSCACPEGMVFCDGLCIDPKTNYANCGAKGACSSDNDTDSDYKGKTCENGYCSNGICQAITSSCADSAKLPCGESDECVDVVSNDKHCGGCNIKCASPLPYCSNRICVQCAENNHCADGKKCNDGKCIECTLRAECGNVDNGTAICDNYKCTAICNPGYHLSDDERSCISDIAECGSEKVNCTAIAHQKSVSCTNGACVVTACKDGYIVNSTKTNCTTCNNNGDCEGKRCSSSNVCKCFGAKKEICSPGQNCNIDGTCNG